MNSKRIFAGWVAALVMACNLKSGSGDPIVPLDGPPPPLDLSAQIEDAPASGALRGFVADELGNPVANATVTTPEGATTSDVNGAFTLSPRPGRLLLRVTADGKADFERSLAVTSRSPGVFVRLTTMGSAQAIGASGGSMTLGPTQLVIPAAAYADGGKVAAVWIDQAHTSAQSGRSLFAMADGAYRTLGQLSVQASAEPTAPATFRVPVPAELTGGQSLVAFSIKSGAMTERLLPISVADGFATFALPHFSSWAVTIWDASSSFAKRKFWRVVHLWQRATAYTASVFGPTNLFPNVAPFEGDDLEPGATVTGPAQVIAPNGSVVDVEAGSMRLVLPDGSTPKATCIDECQVQGEVPTEPALTPDQLKLQLETAQGAEIDVHGTVFSLDQKSCSSANKSAIDTLEVSEGNVTFRLAGSTLQVPAGKRARGCDGCADPRQATCDCDVFACDRAGGQCLVCPGQSSSSNSSFGQPSGAPSFNDANGRPIRNCVPTGTICCNAENGRLSALCPPYPGGRAICQCAGKVAAGCATPNSVCASDAASPGAENVLDCGYGTGRAACKYQSGGPVVGTDPPLAPAVWACFDSNAYQNDVSNCGACGRKCTGKHDACNKGKCIDCNGGCSESQVLVGEFGTPLRRCCAFPPPGRPNVDVLIISANSPEIEGCPRGGYQIATPLFGSHTVADCIQ